MDHAVSVSEPADPTEASCARVTALGAELGTTGFAPVRRIHTSCVLRLSRSSEPWRPRPGSGSGLNAAPWPARPQPARASRTKKAPPKAGDWGGGTAGQVVIQRKAEVLVADQEVLRIFANATLTIRRLLSRELSPD